MKSRSLFAALLLVGTALAAPEARAGLKLPLLFSDGAVLQRDRPIPVWGEALPGAAVELGFDGARVRAKADAQGHWQADLPAHAAGGPYVLSLRSGREHRQLRDVLVGDVWLASGQSNMEWTVAQADNARVELAAATDAGIRHFKVAHGFSPRPQSQLPGGRWVAASSSTVGGFSAVAYFFARELHARTGVPIGIIDSSWGGSRIEAWMDARSNGLDAARTQAEQLQWQQQQESLSLDTRTRIAAWASKPVDEAAWSKPDFDDRDWDRIPAPGPWEDSGYAGMDGVAWYRSGFRLTAAQAAQGARLSLARIDDSDQAWVNGQAVGGLQAQWDTPRNYALPASALHAGWNVVAVRVTDTGGGGGFHGDASEMYVQTGDGQRQSLAGPWRFRPARVSVDAGSGELAKLRPTLLYNRMILPLQPYAMHGVIWYQGESNSGAADAWHYRDQFAAMVKQWRAQWGEAELPFLWVQLANFQGGANEDWALLRESQSRVLALPATAQAVAIDIGDPTDIHPRNKQEVARRLALAARKLVYGEKLVSTGPVFRAAQFQADQARVDFDLQGSHLALRGGGASVPGFELAGADGVFHRATATLHGDQVWVASTAVAQASALRYAWGNDPGPLTLVNAEDLPAAPFRSAAPASDSLTVPAAYKLVWADEFDKPGLPDSAHWSYDTAANRTGWYNDEVQYYSAARPENSVVRDGKLVITARRESLDSAPDWGGQRYSSARLVTRGKHEWTYGFVSVRARLPCGPGTWPAIWMLGSEGEWPASGELDMMEQFGKDPGRILSTTHTAAASGDKGIGGATRLGDVCTAFHDYQMLWTPEAIRFGINGKEHFVYRNEGKGKAQWPYAAPEFLILNIAIGGNLGGPVDEKVLPATMEVDYVRVWQKP